MTKRQRKQRTPEEIIAATEAKLNRLRLKAAKNSDNEIVASLQSGLSNVRSDLTKARKGFFKGPQSFETRIQKHQLWIEQIEAERALAQAQIAALEQEKVELEAAIAHATEAIARGEEPNVDLLMNSEIEVDPQYLENLNAAVHARKSFEATN